MTTQVLGLTHQQAKIVAVVSVFITVIGGFLLAMWFRRKNRTAT